MTQEELEQILQANQETLARVEKSVEKIKKQMLWAKVGGFLKIILIVGPIVVGLFYFSPILKQYTGAMQNALGILSGASTTDLLNSQNGQQVVNSNALEAICDPQSRQAIINQFCN